MAIALALRRRSIVPGFGLSLGITLSYLGLIVLIPLCVLLFEAGEAGWAKIWGYRVGDIVRHASIRRP